MPLPIDAEGVLTAMRELEAHLTGKDAFWSDQVRRAADEVSRSDAHGLRRFLSYFGGAGSLNDLVLHRDGVPLGEENDHLDKLIQTAWSQARSLWDDTDR